MTDETAQVTSKLLCTPWGTAESHRVLFRPDVGCPYCEISHQATEIERLNAALVRANMLVCEAANVCGEALHGHEGERATPETKDGTQD